MSNFQNELKDKELPKKFGKNEALKKILKALAAPLHEDAHREWINLLEKDFPEVFKELVHQYSSLSPKKVPKVWLHRVYRFYLN